MIITRRKPAVKILKNGVWTVSIESITESLTNGKDAVIFKFKCDSGAISLTMPVDKTLHSLLCDLMTYLSIKEYKGLNQFIGGKLSIEIINNHIKHLSKA